MRAKQFFKVFARLVEKATQQPLNEAECDFDWGSYFDSDIPEASQRHCAELAAEEYLSENGWQADPAVVADVVSLMTNLVRGES